MSHHVLIVPLELLFKGKQSGTELAGRHWVLRQYIRLDHDLFVFSFFFKCVL